MILKSLKKNYLEKKGFIDYKPTEKLVTKNMNMILNVWKKSKMKIMRDFHELYLNCDALEKFRKNSFKNYGLCASHYLSAPGLKRDAMLKMTKIKFELILDPEIYTFFEKGTRGPAIKI